MHFPLSNEKLSCKRPSFAPCCIAKTNQINLVNNYALLTDTVIEDCYNETPNTRVSSKITTAVDRHEGLLGRGPEQHTLRNVLARLRECHGVLVGGGQVGK